MPAGNLFTSKGRIPRSTFWGFFAVFYGICAFVGFFSERGLMTENQQAIVGLLLFPLLVMAIIVQIKRWHDRDKSGWWVLINLIPCVGGLWALIECGFLKGTTGPNKYGPDPLQE
jgi:uncharacterized membrane protein YhaH (DUF805 family)